MSRSRKKISCYSDYSRGPGGTKADKRNAAKSVGNHKGEISDGKEYRKLYCSWNIHDYKFITWDVDDEWYRKGLRK